MGYRRPTPEDIENFIAIQEYVTVERRKLQEMRERLRRERARYGPGYNPQDVLDKRTKH